MERLGGARAQGETMKASMQSRAWIVGLAGIIVVGCSAGAQEAGNNAWASLAVGPSGRPGGALVCYGERIEMLSGAVWSTKIHPFNNNDNVSISIDKMIVYASDGSTPCDTLPSQVLAPHATLDLNTTKPPFTTYCSNWPMASSPGVGGFSVVLYWSVVGQPDGYVNGLSAYSDVYQTRSETQFGWTSHVCEAIALHQ
jgi:hypothetical protein